ncbi:Crp/Fnr family transcriptional regulator [Fodinibius salsisoli]|uniref:Crp/Fnr family transcriptional regulator n=1 Tax=Fodinibius salsisoli TaxID=2820877 RepID=A0ABT3PIK5_9BACT|nr:hypothetical protein [Fodinibius salsisoli]MCW9705730.1 Crp/Fnr family transcriptional regulator [Fodinibius salsisoli]
MTIPSANSINRFVRHDPPRNDFDQVKHEFDRWECSSGKKIVNNREICHNLFYLAEGLVRCSNFSDDRTLWFEIEHNFFTIPNSFINQSPSYQELTCLEDSILYTISRKKLRRLCRSDIDWANWWAQLLEKEYLKLEYIYQTLIYKSAPNRYQELIRAIPDIENRVPLKYIASFLGISQVSLSRIRAGKQ